MKKIFSILTLAASFLLINGCASTKNIANDPYSAEGFGVSMISKSVAYDIAFDDAVNKIAKKTGRSISEIMSRTYQNTNATSRRMQEAQAYASTVNESSNAQLFDIVAGKPKYGFKMGKYTCSLKVSVSPENIR